MCTVYAMKIYKNTVGTNTQAQPKSSLTWHPNALSITAKPAQLQARN